MVAVTSCEHTLLLIWHFALCKESFARFTSKGEEVWESIFGCEICESLLMFTIGHGTKNNRGSLGCNRHHLSPWWQEVEFFLAYTKLNFSSQSARALTFYISTENKREGGYKQGCQFSRPLELLLDSKWSVTKDRHGKHSFVSAFLWTKSSINNLRRFPPLHHPQSLFRL